MKPFTLMPMVLQQRSDGSLSLERLRASRALGAMDRLAGRRRRAHRPQRSLRAVAARS